jgi:hypothetical protein
LLIVAREVEPPIFPEDAFFLKQGIDFLQDTQASSEATYVTLDETPLIPCQGHLFPWLKEATDLSDKGWGVPGGRGTEVAVAGEERDPLAGIEQTHGERLEGVLHKDWGMLPCSWPHTYPYSALNFHVTWTTPNL